MWPASRKTMLFLGILVIIAGVLPLITQYNLIALPSFIPTSGLTYQAIIIVLGVLLIIFGKPSKY